MPASVLTSPSSSTTATAPTTSNVVTIANQTNRASSSPSTSSSSSSPASSTSYSSNSSQNSIPITITSRQTTANQNPVSPQSNNGHALSTNTADTTPLKTSIQNKIVLNAATFTPPSSGHHMPHGTISNFTYEISDSTRSESASAPQNTQNYVTFTTVDNKYVRINTSPKNNTTSNSTGNATIASTGVITAVKEFFFC